MRRNPCLSCRSFSSVNDLARSKQQYRDQSYPTIRTPPKPKPANTRKPVEGKERELQVNEFGQVVNVTMKEITFLTLQLLNKRKVALIFGYVGTGYQGLQRNPRTVTIEDEIEKAIYAAGGISEKNYGDFEKISWQRAARTDKGVHALGNVASLKMLKSDDPQIVERINNNLPPTIQVFGLARALHGFDAKKWADFRIYDYLCPTYALKENDSNWKFNEVTHKRLSDLCKAFEGHHNYWNFSVDKKFAEKSSERYLKSVTVSNPFEVGGLEFVKIKFVGLSFMLHQIRKMIAWLLLTYRLNAPTNMITNAFGPKQINIPIAPAQFLYLDKVMYNDYSLRLKDVDSPLPNIDVDTWKVERNQFRKEFVYPRIVADEVEGKLAAEFDEVLKVWKPKSQGVELELGQWLKNQETLDPYIEEAMKRRQAKLEKYPKQKPDGPFWKGADSNSDSITIQQQS